jgi:hypothetical protein
MLSCTWLHAQGSNSIDTSLLLLMLVRAALQLYTATSQASYLDLSHRPNLLRVCVLLASGLMAWVHAATS